jgi:ABC-type branched-subunit amino acid transport system ATPase component
VRTFQQLELFGDLTVRQNLLVAADSAERGSVALMDEAISIFELHDALDWSVQQLPAGRRRLVAAARALASGPRLLLLDEPAAGLDTDESAWLGERLRLLVDGGLAILLVDHDMPLVLSICSRIHVLNFGQTVAEGPPASITRDAAVVMAYLGEEG